MDFFWNFQKINQAKQRDGESLSLLMLQRGIFTTQSNNYDGAFLQ